MPKGMGYKSGSQTKSAHGKTNTVRRASGVQGGKPNKGTKLMGNPHTKKRLI